MAGIFATVHLGSYVQWIAEGPRATPAQPRRPPLWRRVLWPLRWPMALVNLVFAALESIPHPRIFALNNLIIAKRPDREGGPE
jgi:hypothetical protein